MVTIIVLVVILLVLYLILKATGLLDEIIRFQQNPDDNLWSRFSSQINQLNETDEERLDIYRQFFEGDPDQEDD